MKIGIIGGGFTGLSAAYYLSKAGRDVVVIESANHLGGLAAGFKEKNWKWSLEEHYHHWFTNDDSILQLAKEIDFPVTKYKPKTSILSGANIYQFDSPVSLLKFPHLGLLDKLRTGTLMVILKTIPFTKYLENITAKKLLIRWGGKNAWSKLWGPLFVGKFGKYSDKIPAIWFWARIKKRTQYLAYPKGGYDSFIGRTNELIHWYKGRVELNTEVRSVEKKGKVFVVKTKNGAAHRFDKVICTLPTTDFLNITKGLPEKFKNSYKSLKGLGAVTLVLSLNNKFFKDNTYWLNVNEDGYPFLAVVEHTNFIDQKHYNGEHLLYIGNYLETNHKYYKLSANELLAEYVQALQKINPLFKKSSINKKYMFESKFAQPIVPLNYSKKVPKITTPIKGLFLANMQQVYPWDRGTNYAVELGKKVSDIINK